MAKDTTKDKIHVQVYSTDRDRLKRIAEEEERTMFVMFKLVLDHWEKRKK